MNKQELLHSWLQEEHLAHIHGWDFSHISGRSEQENCLPWDYKETINHYRSPQQKLLDIDTGGAEFLLSLGHPYENLAATENYPPNVALCKEKLLPLGIEFKEADSHNDKLPFDDHTFDLVINRHGGFRPEEVYRVLKPKGIFITQQVGAENDRDLVKLLLQEVPPLAFPNQYLHYVEKSLTQVGFTTLESMETFAPIKFYDVGALVWFARVIAWEFPGFSVKQCLPNLYHAQRILEEHGVIEGRTHRFFLVVQK